MDINTNTVEVTEVTDTITITDTNDPTAKLTDEQIEIMERKREKATINHDWWIRQFRMNNQKDENNEPIPGKFVLQERETDTIIAKDIEDWDTATKRSKKVNDAFYAFSRMNQ